MYSIRYKKSAAKALVKLPAKISLQFIEAFENLAVAFDEETLPHDMVCQLVAGHNKIKVWREYRGMTQAALAKQTGLDFLVISSLEIDEYQFTDELVKLIATALLIDVDDLV